MLNECQIQQNTGQSKSAGVENLFGKLSVIYLRQLGGEVIVVQENYLELQSEI